MDERAFFIGLFLLQRCGMTIIVGHPSKTKKSENADRQATRWITDEIMLGPRQL